MRRFVLAALVAAFILSVFAPGLVAGNPGRGISPAQAEGVDGGFNAPEVPSDSDPFGSKKDGLPDPEYGSVLSRIWPFIGKKDFLLAVVPNHPLLAEEGIYWAVRRPTPKDRRGPGYERDEDAIAWAARITHAENGMKVPMLYVIGRADVGSPVVTLWNHSGTSAYDLDNCTSPGGGVTLSEASGFRQIKYVKPPSEVGVKDTSEHAQLQKLFERVFCSNLAQLSRKELGEKQAMVESLDFDPAENPRAYPEYRRVECQQPNRKELP